MKLIRGLHNLVNQLPASAVTIGNFDGVHRGHQQVLKQLRQVAKTESLATIVIIFEPQPSEYFTPRQAPRRLARFRDKINHIREQKIDFLICLRFDRFLAGQSAAEFVRDILVNGLNTKYLVIGDDFRFGKGRQGDYASLQSAGREHGFEVEKTKTLMLDGERISSTRIRESILRDNFPLAAELLGRHYSLSGRIAHGKKLGRELGYPTINIKMGDKTLIVKGIFAVLVKGLDNRTLQGVASIGTRPTVDGVDTILEVFILEFNQDVYGHRVEVEFLFKIRDELKFDSLEELSANIARDIEKAKVFFNRRAPTP